MLFVVNRYEEARAATIMLHGIVKLSVDAKAIVLTSASPDDENSFEASAKTAPREMTVTISGTSLARTFPAYFFTVLRLKTQN